jgi:5,10-methylenetetrahydromethanopterin reductase
MTGSEAHGPDGAVMHPGQRGRAMRFSIRVNNDLPVDRLVELACLAERYGFDQIWVSNDLFLRSAPVLLTVLAGETTRIRIGSGIINPYSVHPAETAMLAATLQEVSGGRFLLDLAAGASEFLGWAGIERTRPLARTGQAVRAIRTLLSGGRPADDPGTGPGWTAQAYLRLPAHPVPIYLGGDEPADAHPGRRMRRRGAAAAQPAGAFRHGPGSGAGGTGHCGAVDRGVRPAGVCVVLCGH